MQGDGWSKRCHCWAYVLYGSKKIVHSEGVVWTKQANTPYKMCLFPIRKTNKGAEQKKRTLPINFAWFSTWKNEQGGSNNDQIWASVLGWLRLWLRATIPWLLLPLLYMINEWCRMEGQGWISVEKKTLVDLWDNLFQTLCNLVLRAY